MIIDKVENRRHTGSRRVPRGRSTSHIMTLRFNHSNESE
jgi:hypothetical protein